MKLAFCSAPTTNWLNIYQSTFFDIYLPSSGFPQVTGMGACGPVALDSRSGYLGFNSQCWPCVEVSGKLRIPHCLGPPRHNGYLVHRSKVGSIVAGCIGAQLARGKVKSVEHMLSWSLDSKQLTLPLPLLVLSSAAKPGTHFLENNKIIGVFTMSKLCVSKERNM